MMQTSTLNLRFKLHSHNFVDTTSLHNILYPYPAPFVSLSWDLCNKPLKKQDKYEYEFILY